MAAAPSDASPKFAIALLVDGVAWDAAPRAAPLVLAVMVEGGAGRWQLFNTTDGLVTLTHDGRRARQTVHVVCLDADGFPLTRALVASADVDAPAVDAWYAAFPAQRRLRDALRSSPPPPPPSPTRGSCSSSSLRCAPSRTHARTHARTGS